MPIVHQIIEEMPVIQGKFFVFFRDSNKFGTFFV